MVRFDIECPLPFSRQQFWRLRATKGFFDFIVADGLLKSFQVSKAEYDDDGWGTRVQQYTPANVDCPDVVRALVGDTMFEVNDEQRWNDNIAPFEQQFHIRPSFLAGLSRTSGLLKICQHPEEEITHEAAEQLAEMDASSSSDSLTDPEADASDSCSDSEFTKDPTEKLLASLSSDEKCIHQVTGETRVSILTVGWFVERAIVHNLRLFYKQYPATVARFRQKLYTDFADGDMSVPVQQVVDRFLNYESEMEDEANCEEHDNSCDNMKVFPPLDDPESVFVDA